MIRFALSTIVMSCVAAATLFCACGDSAFEAGPATDAQADAGSEDVFSASDSASDGGATIHDAGKITPIQCVDAGDGGDGGHTLCDTFDGTQLSDFWIINAACSPPLLDTANSVSPPSSLATNDLGSGTNCASVYASVPSPASTRFSSSFDVYVDSETSKLAPFFAIWVSTADFTFYEIALTTDTSGKVNVLENLTFTDAAATYDITPINAAILTPDAWNKVSISISFAGPNAVDVALGDGTPFTLPLQHRPSLGSITNYRVYLGIPNGGDTKAAAHFDDFVCDVTP